VVGLAVAVLTVGVVGLVVPEEVRWGNELVVEPVVVEDVLSVDVAAAVVAESVAAEREAAAGAGVVETVAVETVVYEVPGAEPVVEAERFVERRVEPKPEPKSEPKPERRVERKAEPRVERKAEPRVERKVAGGGGREAEGKPGNGGAVGGAAAGRSGGERSGGAVAGGVKGGKGRMPQPPYPGFARSRGLQGTVVVSIRASADGAVTSASVARSSGHADLDRYAVSWIRGRWKLAAGQTSATQTIHFRIR
jgi:protein TonB